MHVSLPDLTPANPVAALLKLRAFLVSLLEGLETACERNFRIGVVHFAQI